VLGVGSYLKTKSQYKKKILRKNIKEYKKKRRHSPRLERNQTGRGKRGAYQMKGRRGR